MDESFKLQVTSERKLAMERKLEKRLFAIKLGFGENVITFPISPPPNQQTLKQMNSANYIQNLRDLQFYISQRNHQKLLQPNKIFLAYFAAKTVKTYLGR
jgi:hypothetical protein